MKADELCLLLSFRFSLRSPVSLQYSKRFQNPDLINKIQRFLKKNYHKPVVGSSRKINDGLVNNSTPIEVLFLSPPETPLIKVLPIIVC